jgi:ElaB/YqjD/DUF883 family membrane-anchored ribosome-binding protein
MTTTQQIDGKRHELSEKLKERWDQLTETDLAVIEQSMEHLIATIQQKTGEARAAVGEVLHALVDEGGGRIKRGREAAREYAAEAAEAVQQKYDQVAEGMRTGYRQAEGIVKERPLESVAIAFGTGILTGLIVSLVARR